MRRPLLLAAVLAAALPTAASAQTRSTLFGSAGGSTGSGAGTSSASGMSGLGGSSGTSAGMSSGMFGSSTGSGAGGARTGSGVTGTGQANTQLGSTSGQAQLGASSIGSGAFVGRSDNTGRLVGQRLAGQNANLGSLMQGLQGLQGLGRNSGFENGQSQNATPKLGIRPTLRIGFDAPRSMTPTVATQRIATRLPKITSRRPDLAGVALATDGAGRTVLRGNVPNQEAGELAAALVRLEPGVGEVVNELTIAPAAAGTTP